MELYILFTTITVVVVTFAVLFRFLSIKIPNGSATPLPPGKMGWPIVGESLNYFSCLTEGRPEKFFQERIRKYASSVFKSSFLGIPFIVMYGSEGNKFLFKNDGKLVEGWWPKTVHKIIPSSMARSSRIAHIIHSNIKSDVLQDYVGIMDSSARAHFQAKWHAGNEVKVNPAAKEYGLTLVCKLFLSIDDPDFIASLAGPFTTLMGGLTSVPIDLPWTRFGRGFRASKLVIGWMKTRVVERRRELLSAAGIASTSHRQDMFSQLMLMKDENGKPMSDDAMAERLMGFVLAGHDTSASVITIVFKYLGENPDIYDKVYQEQKEIASNKATGEVLNWHDILKMKYTWNVAQEAMRMYSPSQMIFREATSDFTYHGYNVPKGWKIQMSVHATHRDPQYFPNPEEFDPSRFEDNGPPPYTYFPFGGGSRLCPGRNYAQVLILIFLHNAVNRFKWKAIYPDEKMVPIPNLLPEKGLPIRLYQH